MSSEERQILGTYNEKIFFYCRPSGSPENTVYHHAIVCLAEGLMALEIPFYSNINYWQTSPGKKEYLLRHDPQVTPDDCSIVVLDHDWFFDCKSSLPKNLFHPGRKYATVYLDSADGTKTHSWEPEFRQFDFIFKAHYNSRCRHPSNLYPSAFGLSNRILGETDIIPPFSKREKSILFNFRADHSVRMIARNNFCPAIQKVLQINNSVDSFDSSPSEAYHYLMWTQTGRRHYHNYYKTLKKMVACAGFGGYFVQPFPRDPAAPNQVWHRVLNKLNFSPKRILQWDSWRLWESLASGCVTFHVDFEKYGLRLPVMPVNWHHYIGIDLDNIQKTVDRIINEPEILERISNEGRHWALKHYSPMPNALRFLKTIRK